MPVKKEEKSETPREYYYRLFQAKKDGESWTSKIPVDSIIYFADNGKEELVIDLTARQRKKCYGDIAGEE